MTHEVPHLPSTPGREDRNVVSPLPLTPGKLLPFSDDPVLPLQNDKLRFWVSYSLSL